MTAKSNRPRRRIWREPVDSSSIRSVDYDPDNRILELEYAGGNVYQYYEVPEGIHIDLMCADSKGRFVNFRIKPYYSYKKIR